MIASTSFRDVAGAELDKDQEKTSESTITSSDTQETTPEVKAQPADQQEEKKTNPGEESSESVKPFAEKPELAGKTPEQLEQIYADWQKKYTQQRQKEVAEMKKYQAEMARLNEQLKKTQQTPVESASVQDRKDEAQRQYELGNMTLEQYTEYVKNLVSQDVLTQVSAMNKAQAEETYQQGFVDEFFSVDDRLNQNGPNFSPRFFKIVANDMAEALDAYIAEHGTSRGFSTKEVASKIIAEYDSEVNEMMKARAQQNGQAAREKAASSAKSPSVGSSSQSTKSVRGKSFRDILEDQELS